VVSARLTLLRRLFLLLPALLLGACENPPDHILVFGITGSPASLHPTLASDAVSERINALLYAPLVELDQQGRPTPGQVRWQQEDAQHYRLILNDAPAVFSDGSQPSIDDVAATLRSVLDDQASPHAATLAHIAELQLLDRSSLRVSLSKPDPRFVEKLHLGLAPAAALADSRKLARKPVGNGPFAFVAWDAQDNLLLRRRRDGQLLRFEAVPDPTMRALKLLRGELQLLQNDLPYELYPRLRDEPGIELHSAPGTTFSYLGFNLRDPHSGDLRVRQAIAHAVDRQAIVRYLFGGHASLSNTLLRPQHWAANPALPVYQHDPQRARELLAALGYGPDRPLQLSYKTSTDPFRLRVAAALQAQLAQVGIRLQIQSYEWGTFFGDIKAGRFQLYSLSWVGIRSPDIFRYVFHSDSQPPHGANRGRYQSVEVDRLIEQAESLPPEQAQALFRQVQDRIHRDLVYVPLWHEQNLLLSRGISGAQPQVDGGYGFLDKVSLADE